MSSKRKFKRNKQKSVKAEQSISQQAQSSSGSNWVYPLLDGSGNVRAVVDSQGNILERREYDPFGNLISQTGTRQTVYDFAGEPRDENNLIHMRARDYDPNKGRFISPDPIEGSPPNPHAINPYIYANNNPINYSDPSGMYSVPFNTTPPIPPAPVPPMPPSARPPDPAAYWLNKLNVGCNNTNVIHPDSYMGFLNPNPMYQQNCSGLSDPIIASEVGYLQVYGVTIENVCDWERNPNWQPELWLLNARAAISTVKHVVILIAERLNELASFYKYSNRLQDTFSLFRAIIGSLRLKIRPNAEFLIQASADGTITVTWAALDGTRNNSFFQLMVHEIAHMINYRWSVQGIIGDGSSADFPQCYYEPEYSELERNEGYRFYIRSSDADYELVTDALANWFLNGFTGDSAGDLRRDQVTSMLISILSAATRRSDSNASCP